MNTRNFCTRVAIVGMVFSILTLSAFAESRSERRERENAESAKAVKVPGGTTLALDLAFADAFPAIVRTLQKADYTIESASKDAGSIVTQLVVAGSYRQTGTRAQITVIDEGNGKTTVKVAVTTQKRYNGLQTEPWNTATLDADQSQKLATILQDALVPKK